jgi:hypothetical protein
MCDICFGCLQNIANPGQVNSNDIGLQLSASDCPWPYAVNGLPASLPGYNAVSMGMEAEFGQFFPGSQATLTSTLFPGSTRLPRYPVSNNPLASLYSTPSSSMDCYGSYNAGAGEGILDTYSNAPLVQYPIHQETSLSGGVYGAQDSSRIWAPSASQNRCPTTYEATAATYGPSSLTSGLSVVEPGHIFPTLGTLAMSLPHQLPNQRVLPRPEPSSETVPGSSHAIPGELGTFFPSSSSMRSTMSWGPEKVTNGATQASSTGPLSSINQVVTLTSSKASCSPQEPQDTQFGYMPIKHTPPTTITSTAAYLSPQATSSTTSTDSNLLNSACSASSYCCVGSPKRGSQSSCDGALINGQIYTQLQQPLTPLQGTLSLDIHGRESIEQAAQSKPRTSTTGSGASRR